MSQTREENFLKFLDNAIANGNGVEIEMDNPKEPFLQSKGYSNKALPQAKIDYQKEYDNDLKLNNDKSVRIKEYKFI